MDTQNLWSIDTFHINKDYTSGDHDAIMTFNNGMATLKLEYLSSLNVRQFSLDERLRLYKAMSTDADFGGVGGDGHGWALRTEAAFNYPTWGLGAGYTGATHEMSLTNNLNDLAMELAMSYGYVYSLSADSNAVVYGYGVDMIKQNPAATNSMIGYSALLCSNKDPSTALQGVAFRAVSRDISGYTGVRQYAGLLVHGQRGFKYPLLCYDVNDTTELFIVDQSGNGYYAGNLTVADIYGSSSSGQNLTLSSNPSHNGKIYFGANKYFDEALDTFVGLTATMVGLGNVTNESKATMFTTPTFTGTQVFFPDGTATDPGITFTSRDDTGFYYTGGALRVVVLGTERFKFESGDLIFQTNDGTIQLGASHDVILVHDAANVLGLRNSTNAQQFNWYATYTDASNYEGGYLTAAAGSVTLGARTLGTGTDNIDLALVTAGTGVVKFGTYSAKAAEAFDGYITIKDAAGNARKIMTCA